MRSLASLASSLASLASSLASLASSLDGSASAERQEVAHLLVGSPRR